MQKALAPEISTWPEENPQLIGSKCASCSAVVFPRQDRCPHCSGWHIGHANARAKK